MRSNDIAASLATVSSKLHIALDAVQRLTSIGYRVSSLPKPKSQAMPRVRAVICPPNLRTANFSHNPSCHPASVDQHALTGNPARTGLVERMQQLKALDAGERHRHRGGRAAKVGSEADAAVIAPESTSSYKPPKKQRQRLISHLRCSS